MVMREGDQDVVLISQMLLSLLTGKMLGVKKNILEGSDCISIAFFVTAVSFTSGNPSVCD